MDYVIYTYGGGEVLWRVFNGLSLFFQSDSAYLTSVVKLSLAVGGLWAALRALYGGQLGILTRDYVIPVYIILNVLLLPKTSVHIVDEVSSTFKYSKVDHVPIGIAAVTSTASKLSRFITDRLEHSLKTAEANHYGKTGPMFAARLTAMARDMRVVDPVQRQNMKDFVRQCFTLPFVWTNLLAGKKAALETSDILGLIAAHPHRWLGSYWQTSEGKTEFLYCRAGVVKARAILNAEIPQGLGQLATEIFGNGRRDSAQSTQKLKTYFDDAWSALSHQTASAHEMAAQEMMMNAYREGLDDKRQEFGLERLNPQLIAYSTARGRMQQNTGFSISSQMFSLMGPSLQSTLLAILCVLFVVVVPMTFLPGGLSTFGMWVKLIVWVESWPVFYALINSVALMIASGRTAAYRDAGAGLSLLTQNSLADAAWDAYSYAEGFMCLVPVLAWAVISRSGYALANLSSSLTRGVEGLASKMGSEITDGNLSFDNQSFHHRSVANQQMAQQQLGGAFSFGHKYDDGRMNVTWDTEGTPLIQEAQTTLKTNVSGTDSLAASLTENAQEATTAGHTFSKSASESLTQGLNDLYSYASQYTKAQSMGHRFGTSQDTGEGQDWKNTLDAAHKFAQDNKISDDKAFQILSHAGANTGALKLAGIDAGIRTQVSGNSTDSTLIDKAHSSGLADQFGHHLSSAFKKSTGRDGSLSDQEQKTVLDSLQGNFSKAQAYQEQAQSNFNQAETYTKAASLAETSTFSATTNWNDHILQDVADKKFGGNRVQAATWQSHNPEAYRAHADTFMSGKQEKLIQSLKADHPLSQEDIRQKFEGIYKGRVLNDVRDSSRDTVDNRAFQEGLGASGRQTLTQDVQSLRTSTEKGMESAATRLDIHKASLQKSYQDQESDFNKRQEEGISKNIPFSGTIKNLGKEAGHIEDFGEGTSSYHGLAQNQSYSPSYEGLEKDIAHHQVQNKMSSQGRHIKQLKDSIEMTQEMPSEEMPFEIPSSQIVER